LGSHAASVKREKKKAPIPSSSEWGCYLRQEPDALNPRGKKRGGVCINRGEKKGEGGVFLLPTKNVRQGKHFT